MTERRRTIHSPTHTSWTPSPSPSPSPTSSPPDSPTALSSAMFQAQQRRRRLDLDARPPPRKPSQVKSTPGTEPLLKISQDELGRIAWDDDDDDDNDDEQPRKADSHVRSREVNLGHEVDEPIALWEELVNALLWTIPFGFLYTGMDLAVHAQYGQDLTRDLTISHLSSFLPTIYLLNLLSSSTSHSTSPFIPTIPPLILHLLLVLLCTTTGTHLVHVTSTQSYLKVLAQAPALGSLWVWSVVKMDLGWALLGLGGVGIGVGMRGEWARVKWWV